MKPTLRRTAFRRLLSLVFIIALVLSHLTFPFREAVKAEQISERAAKSNLSAPESFELNSVSRHQSLVLSLTGNIWTRAAENLLSSETPAGLGAAKEFSLAAKITESWKAAAERLGFAAAAASAPVAQQPSGTVQFDYDGDGKADLSRWQSSAGEWRFKSSLNGAISNQTLGWSTDKIVPADYDQDGKTDIASFSESSGTWTIKQSSTGTNISRTLGQTGDIPVAANYGGDARADIAVFRPSNSTWYYIVTGDATNTVVSQSWGASGDTAVPGNYDGDGRADFAVFRPSTGYWFVLQSSNGGMTSIQWGLSSDTPVPADYDGDGKTDPAVYRPSIGSWYAYKSSTANGEYVAQTWGNWGDQPVPADYNNDGRADFAVWRPKTGIWHIAQTAAGGGFTYSYQQLGISGDLATPAAYLKKVGASVAMPWVHKERLSPKNATGGIDLYSQNFAWSAALVGLPGRAGLDAGFGISYNSLIWTKVPTDTETAMIFDADSSSITPGFRFGFPVIEQSYPDYRTGRFTYIMVTPSGARVDFRQIAASDTYETGDTSYAQLKVVSNNGPNTPVEDLQITVMSSDGTQMKYVWLAGLFRCAEIKDSNGNRININHDATGLLRTVTDTLGRIVTVNYDAELYPISITQTRKNNNGAGADTTYTWATFSYVTDAGNSINTNFASGLSIYGPANGTVLKVLSRITRADNSYTAFSYNSYGQVKKITNYAANNDELNSIATNLDAVSGAQTDCPRFTQTRTKAANFNQNQEVVITNVNETVTVAGLSEPVTRTTVTAPDGITTNGVVVDKSYALQSGWREALPFQTETCTSTNCTGTDKKRWTSTAWTQDDASLFYPLNPRVAENTVSDQANSRKTTVEYWTVDNQPTTAKYGRVKETKIYNNLTGQLLKKSSAEYKDDAVYITKRILGLPTKAESYGLNEQGAMTLAAKIVYGYDEGGLSDATLEQNISPVQHDAANYGTSFVAGRGNLTSTARCDAALSASACVGGIASSAKYNTAGAVVAQTTPGSAAGTTRTIKISYADSFNDNNNSRNTYAYPTKLTDPAGYFSEVKYRFDTGANVWARSPAPAGHSTGKETTRQFDLIGRLDKELVWKAGAEYAYTRYEYFSNNIQSKVFSTVTDANNNGTVEAADEVLVSETFADGAGRTRKSRSPLSFNSDGSIAAYSAQYVEYDVLGRAKRQSAPAETNDVISGNGNWKIPATSPDYRGEDGGGNSLYLWTSYNYDWKGRVTETVNTDGTNTLASYEGCGCAGGETVTLQGESVERNDAPGAFARRTQKIYADILGRQYKSEILDYNNQVYTTTVNTFNERDQTTKVRQSAGAETNPTFQDAVTSYDGYGRIKTRRYPVEDSGTNTDWVYNADDSIHSVTDARGAVATYGYDVQQRGLLTNVSYSSPNTTQIPLPPAASFAYDAAGNRTSMTQTASGSQTSNTAFVYDQLSRLTSETVSSVNYPATYQISYQYHLNGELKSYTDPFNQQISYQRDRIGRLEAVSGSAFGSGTNQVTEYADQMQYRAWGAVKQLRYRTDDSAQVKISYDNRLRVSEHRVETAAATGGYLKRATFEYSADSRLKMMDNLVHAAFDRQMSYDFAGRLSGSQFGQALNDQGSLVTSYTQTISYDRFSQITGRQTATWGRDAAFVNTHLNGRIQAYPGQTITYNAAGQITFQQGSDPNVFQQTKYDAAGRSAEFTERWATAGSYTPIVSERVLSTKYDALGRAVKQTQTMQRISSPPQAATTDTTYRIYSTVLGGVLSEIENHSSGSEKRKTEVYAGGAAIAEQLSDPQNASQNQVVWNHSDPVTGSNQKVVKTGVAAAGTDSRTEYEPLGQEIKRFDPPPQFEPAPTIAPAPVGDSLFPEWQCSLPVRFQ